MAEEPVEEGHPDYLEERGRRPISREEVLLELRNMPMLVSVVLPMFEGATLGQVGELFQAVGERLTQLDGGDSGRIVHTDDRIGIAVDPLSEGMPAIPVIIRGYGGSDIERAIITALINASEGMDRTLPSDEEPPSQLAE